MPETTTEGLGTILSVWAHPDDEVYLSGAIMSSAADAGQRVVCVTATRGEGGFPDNDERSAHERSELRQRELQASLEILGVTEHHWLGHPDGGCADVDIDHAVTPLIEILEGVKPDTVLTFGPDGMTGHPDHISVGRWVTEAVRRTSAASDVMLLYATKVPEWNSYFFGILDPALVMMVDGMRPPETDPEVLALWFEAQGERLRQKVTALGAQSSQTDGLRRLVGEDGYRVLVKDEFFRRPTVTDLGL